jgi:hypothetical protein
MERPRNVAREGSDPYLLAEDAADYLHMSVGALAKLRLTGQGPRFSYHGRGKRNPVYTHAALDAWSAERRRGSTSEGAA